jgi:AraC-like DNA-binding protein
MADSVPMTVLNSPRRQEDAAGAAFAEAPAWKAAGGGWRPLHSGFRDHGYSVEWHDFNAQDDLNWAHSFHPRSLEICLNVAGSGEVQAGNRVLGFLPLSAGFYAQNQSRLTGWRRGGQRHQFITIELSLSFLERHIPADERDASAPLRDLFARQSRGAATVSEPMRLTQDHQQMVATLRHPPVSQPAQRLWYQAKALEVAAALLYPCAAQEELFCHRRKRLNRERVQKVLAILNENLADPPPLEEIGRRVGCSHFYLSRIFTEEMGKTISACLRDLRLERAASLLRQGRMNVTEVAMEVGYSSLSHFSAAFHRNFGCCPGLYPLVTASQKVGATQLTANQ